MLSSRIPDVRRALFPIVVVAIALAVPASASAAQSKAPAPASSKAARVATPKKPATKPNRAGERLARSAAITLNGSEFLFLGCTDYKGWLYYRGWWTSWNTTTRVCKFQEVASELAIGVQEDYYYWSTQGWILYRIRKCGPGSTACYSPWVRTGY